MNALVKLISVSIITLGLNSAASAAPTAQVKADAGQINAACTQDAQVAGCSGEVVGKGLFKCLHNYKKANKSYKFSPGCKAAVGKLHDDKAAGR
jgi:hypothetical protein